MRVTIRKIAELAGVSRGTVDRVLNGRPGVKPEVRENIFRIAAELKYVPNMAGKALAFSKKPITFGIIMPPIEITFFDDIRKGISVAAEELNDFGIRLEYRYVSNCEPHEAVAAIEELIKLGVSGIMISVMDDPLIRESINRAVEKCIPVITFNSDIMDCRRLCFVGQDVYKSGRVAAGLMSKVLDKGGKVLIVTGNMKFHAHRARVYGFLDRICELQNQVEIIQIIEGFDRYQDTYDKLPRNLIENQNIKGIYLATGHVGACLDAVKECKLEKEIHIICNDIIPEVVLGMREGIIDFTIVQNPFAQGYKPLRLLYEYVFSGKEPEREYFYTDTSIVLLENLEE